MSRPRYVARTASIVVLLAALSAAGAWVAAGAGAESEAPVLVPPASHCAPVLEHAGMDGEGGMMDGEHAMMDGEGGMMDGEPTDHHGSPAASPSPAATPAGHAGHHAASPSPSTTGDTHEPGSCPEAEGRRIAVRLTDSFRIEPGAISVPAGVPVSFVITNSGLLPHEFVIGDAAAQQAHEGLMRDADAMAHHPEGAVSVAPGETRVLTWVFAQPGETLAGCHVPGHYDAGMRATITVLP